MQNCNTKWTTATSWIWRRIWGHEPQVDVHYERGYIGYCDVAEILKPTKRLKPGTNYNVLTRWAYKKPRWKA